MSKLSGRLGRMCPLFAQFHRDPWIQGILVTLGLILTLSIFGCAAPPAGPSEEEQPQEQTPSTPTNPEAPVVDAGSDRTVVVGDEVVIQGSVANDPDGSYTYQWRQIDGPPVEIIGADTLEMRYNPTEPGTYTFELTVSDGTTTSTSTVTVTVTPDITNLPPTANAGADRVVKPAQVVDLDGRASSDPEGQTLTYHWRQISGTAVTLQNADAAVATFTSPQVQAAEDLVFELYIKDAGQLDAVDSVKITVEPAPVQKTQYNLAVAIQGSGTVDPPSAAYDEGTTLTLTATPDAGWIFDHWEGDVVGLTSPLTVTMNANKYVTAVFTVQGQVAAPVFSPPDNTHFADKLQIQILCSTPGAKIYYTMDDTEPTTSSTLYTGTIELHQSATIKARAFMDNMIPSDITNVNYYAMLVPGS